MKKNSDAKSVVGAITIADVAKHAGVSTRTVSRFLNQSSLVNAATRRIVEAAIEELGFKRSARALGLATGRSFLIGAIYHSRDAPFIDSVFRGIVAEGSARGYELVVHPTKSDEEGVVEEVVDFVHRSHVDGVVVLSPICAFPGVAEALADAAVPAVAVSSVPLDGYSGMVLSDERGASADVARHLLEIGHRQIAMICGPSNAHSARERRAGFVTALAESGHGLIGEAQGDYGFESGVLAAHRLISLEPAPTAIFAANDIMAAGVLKAAASRGISVPDQLAVIGFDDSSLSQMVVPALSSVKRPIQNMALQATACLIDLVEGRAARGEMVADLELIIRESSARPQRN